ncbi:P-loop containing nucleoside triphosphate hydrolase protein [Mycena galericulata]|nr:P-loop containing nucleoside triphosphate hydrolase protein [Mycena galericulata]
MDHPEVFLDLEIQEFLQQIRELPLPQLESLAAEFLPENSLPSAYIDSLGQRHKTISLRASLLVHIVTKYGIVPRQYQLEANNGLEDGREILIDSGTGSGKTLCLIIPNLLHPDTSSMTISPLKRLQILQAAELERWGIRTICINEDTPSDKELWNALTIIKKICTGHFQHLIVQPEQLKSFHGDLPRLAKLLNVPQFIKTIARVHIDEAHFHYTAGLPHYGLPAFRPSLGALNELRIRLSKGTPIQALSATFPPHIKSAVMDHLNFDPLSCLSLKLCSNHPNVIYATHRIVGSLSDFRNLDFLISIPFTRLLKVVVFHDDIQQCADAASYLDKRLPAELQNTGIVRHYHGGMSKEYLTQIFEDFSKDDGVCRILNGTEGLSTGLDVGGIDAVIDYGDPREKPTAIQRGGRCRHRGQMALLSAVDPESNDPDRPISSRLLVNAKKPARAGLAMILFVRSETCLREMIASYLVDKSRDALEVSSAWCCDRPHPNNPTLRFDKRTFFPGRFIYEDATGAIYAGDLDEPDRVWLNPPKSKKRKAKEPPNRKVVDRADLQERLRDWLATSHASDPLRAVRPASFILDAKGIKALTAVHPDRMLSLTTVNTEGQRLTVLEGKIAFKTFNSGSFAMGIAPNDAPRWRDSTDC